MNWKLIVGTIAGISFLIFFIYMMKRFEVTNNPAFWIVIGVLFFMVVTVFSLFYILENRDKKDSGKKLYNHFTRINELLTQMPNADIFRWQGGESTRISTKAYDNRTYLAVVGNTANFNKRQLTIYCIDDDDIVRFIGDPSPKMESDPFYKFVPKHIDRNELLQRLYQSKRARRGMNINIGSPSTPPPVGPLDDNEQQ